MPTSINKAIFLDLKELTSLAENHNTSDQEIFRKINHLDNKYTGNKLYAANINGSICNIGSTRRSINLLNFTITRLQKQLESSTLEKLNYDLGNAILCITEIKNPYPHKIEYLINSKKFNESRYFLNKVTTHNTYYPTAITNSANILEKYGRNLEAIYLYDKAIHYNEHFGMALGNKAQSIEYYINLSPQKSLRLMDIACSLYKKSLTDKDLEEIGGPHVRDFFISRIKFISDYLENCNFTPHQLNKKPTIKSKYLKFCLERNLFLNWDFGHYYDKYSTHDSFFPAHTFHTSETKSTHADFMPKRSYFIFQIFNQILESYTTSRFQFFQAINTKTEKLDDLVNYTYTFDHSKHSHNYGAIKNVMSCLYNCLDKIGHLLHYNFLPEDEDESRDIYFHWLLDESFKNIIIKQNNYQLLALRSLALDFQKGQQYSHLNKIRNRITHSFLSITPDYSTNHDNSDEKITEISLIKSTEEMFLIVKSALMYTTTAFSQKPQDTNLYFPITVTPENKIFGEI
jgi:hypothetical protein